MGLERRVAMVSEKLSSLGLSGVDLIVDPDLIDQLAHLTELDLGNCDLAVLPEWIGQLTGLTSLNLSGNQLTGLPDSVGQLTRLTSLDLSDNQLTELPDSIGRLTRLATLRLDRNWLGVLPEWIGQLTGLTSLDLSSNQLTVLPDWIGKLTTLTHLYLARDQLTMLPDWIGRLAALTSLDLSGNQLTMLPDSIGQLTALTELYIHHNELAVLPDSIGQLTRLTRLGLARNHLAAVPDSFGQLISLTGLDLSQNRLAELPDSIGQLTSLVELHVEYNGLTAVPDRIGQLTRLTTLRLSRNRLKALPDSIGRLTGLAMLALAGNRLTMLPDSIGLLTALTSLELSDNELAVLPDSIGRLKELIRLGLGSNKLTILPDPIGQLTRLPVLDLSGNQLAVLPDSIGRLTELSSLLLGHNRLTALPDSIGQLTGLTWLDLSDNQLAVLPDSIGRIDDLDRLELGGNQRLSTPPREICAQGPRPVVLFLRGLINSAVESWQSKILIVGEATVGKTSLARQLLGEEFNLDERQTHGVRVRSLPLPHPDKPDVTMALNVWDFGGQLEYRATQRFYLTDRSLFLLVWNYRARANDARIIGWLDAITARAPDSPILLVATHGDEDSPATLPHDLTNRYPQIVGVHTIDSRTRLGIDDLRDAITRHAAALPLMGARWPTTWDAAAHTIDDLPGLAATTHRLFRRMAEAGVPDRAAQEAIARTLHDLGRIAYFADIPDLATKVILQPAWLDARITQAIDSRAVTEAGGVLSRAERQRLWGDLADDEDDPDLPDRLIRMMEAFDLAYRVGNADDSPDVALIVDRLPDSPPLEVDRIWREKCGRPGTRQIAIIYKLGSRQAGIPSWFIAREHRYTTGLHWRHGALLHDRDPGTPAWALLSDDGREQPTITLRVASTYPVRFLSVLTEAFDTIVRDRYPGLVEERLVPCICQADGGGHCPHAFTLEELQAEATAEEPDADYKVRCPKSRRKIEAALMLDGLRGTGVTAQLDALHHKLDTQTSTLNAIDAHQQAVLNGIRTLLEHRANAGVHCPGLLTIHQDDRSGLLHRGQITVSLWCEWPSRPHLLDGEDGRYTIAKAPEALIRYLPYLRHLITALGLAAPVLGAVGVTLGDRVQAEIEAATRTLEFIEKCTGVAALIPEHGAPTRRARTIRAETGADFRALRDMLHALDPDNEKNWGGLSPVSRPEDRRIFYLCQHHTHELNYPYTATQPAL
jgi:internalin A